MTIGTYLYTLFNGRQIGIDEFGNRYFEARSKKEKRHGRRRRWVLYKGDSEASRVPAEWHAWLHHMVEHPLTEKAANSKFWQKKHQENKTGTSNAYRPKGHVFSGRNSEHDIKVYEPWMPE